MTQIPPPAKNPAAVALGKLGGAKKSLKKTLAARANIRKRWAKTKGLKQNNKNTNIP